MPRLRPPHGHPGGPPPRPVPVPVHNLTLAGRRTSVRLEPLFWQALRELATAEGLSLAALADRVEAERGEGMALTAALRVLTIAYWRSRALRTGPWPAGSLLEAALAQLARVSPALQEAGD